MKRIRLHLFFLCLPLTAAASHGWSDIDLCSVYKDRLPPGLTAESLPQADSQGASLLVRYCTQCHNLPGPDRHSAAEWRDVASRMFMLMDVSKLLGRAREKIETIQSEQRTMLLAYLERHAAPRLQAQIGADSDPGSSPGLTRGLSLLPLLLLTGIGLLRWRRTLRKHA